PLTDLGGKTSIFSHPVYLFLREFSLQDFRGGSRYPDRLPLTGYAQGVFRQHAKIPLRINLLTSQHDKPALRLFSLRCILSR
ncbi:hypothetical protein E4534_22385, partial [Escherichia coli]|nr:hypothetical protein [Escherichia coli]